MINSTFEVFDNCQYMCLRGRQSIREYCLKKRSVLHNFFALNCYSIFVTHRWNNLSNMQSIGLRNIMTQGLYAIAYNTWACLAYTGWTVSDNKLTHHA